jgi:hypothetical protein
VQHQTDVREATAHRREGARWRTLISQH